MKEDEMKQITVMIGKERKPPSVMAKHDGTPITTKEDLILEQTKLLDRATGNKNVPSNREYLNLSEDAMNEVKQRMYSAWNHINEKKPSGPDGVHPCLTKLETNDDNIKKIIESAV